MEDSDIDIRGCTLNSKADLLGMGSFEQVVDAGTDTTVYAFNKLLGLLMDIRNGRYQKKRTTCLTPTSMIC